MSELYDLEHNERESCLKPFLDKCDDNRLELKTKLKIVTCSNRSGFFCTAISSCRVLSGADASVMPIVLVLLCGGVPSPDFWVHTFLPAIQTDSFYLPNATLLSVPAGAWINTVLSRMVRGLEANLIAVSTDLLSQFNFVSIYWLTFFITERVLQRNGLMNSLGDNDEDDSVNQLDDSDEMEEGSGDY